jgi:hypothetical protein
VAIFTFDGRTIRGVSRLRIQLRDGGWVERPIPADGDGITMDWPRIAVCGSSPDVPDPSTHTQLNVGNAHLERIAMRLHPGFFNTIELALLWRHPGVQPPIVGEWHVDISIQDDARQSIVSLKHVLDEKELRRQLEGVDWPADQWLKQRLLLQVGSESIAPRLTRARHMVVLLRAYDAQGGVEQAQFECPLDFLLVSRPPGAGD